MINWIDVDAVNTTETSVEVSYTIDSTAPDSDLYVWMKDEKGINRGGGSESDLQGTVGYYGLGKDTLYQNWTIYVWYMPTLEVESAPIPDFYTKGDYYLNSIDGTLIDMTTTSATFAYTIDSNVDPSRLKIEVTNYSGKIMASGLEANLGGEITVENLAPETIHLGWHLKAYDLDHPWLEVSKLMPSFETPVENPVINFFFFASLETTPTSATINYFLGTNFLKKDTYLTLYNEKGDVITYGTEKELNGKIVANDLTPNTYYSGWTLLASYKYDYSVQSSIDIVPFTTPQI